MVPLKPREIRNYLLEKHLPFGLIAKISILRMLEVIHAIPPSTLIDFLEKCTSSSNTSISEDFVQKIDSFLEEYCKIPPYLVKGIQLTEEDEDLSNLSANEMEVFLKKICTSEYSEYFRNLDDDFLGKLDTRMILMRLCFMC